MTRVNGLTSMQSKSVPLIGRSDCDAHPDQTPDRSDLSSPSRSMFNQSVHTRSDNLDGRSVPPESADDDQSDPDYQVPSADAVRSSAPVSRPVTLAFVGVYKPNPKYVMFVAGCDIVAPKSARLALLDDGWRRSVEEEIDDSRHGFVRAHCSDNHRAIGP